MNGQEHTPDTHPDFFAKWEVTEQYLNAEREKFYNLGYEDGYAIHLLKAISYFLVGWGVGLVVGSAIEKINF